MTVCLLVMLVQPHPHLALVVAANRDEWLDRPAVPMAVLRDAGPRVLGGRDELAGGTWLAVNEAGVVAGLTNSPTAGGRDPAKRSRGELPIVLAGHSSAAAAVEAFASEVRPADYNPAWLLVGDRHTAFAVDMTGNDTPVVQPLPPGIHILENRPPGTTSPKVDHVRGLVADIDGLPADALVRHLQAVLCDHQVPAGPAPVNAAGEEIPPQVKAACVHTERYGTRWSCVTTVAANSFLPPTIRYANGPPCQAPYRDAGQLW